MRQMLTTLAATALALAACDSPQEKAAERQADIVENQVAETADRMQDHADLLNMQANTMSDEAAVAVATDANTLAVQADKTKEVVDEAGDRIEKAAR